MKIINLLIIVGFLATQAFAEELIPRRIDSQKEIVENLIDKSDSNNCIFGTVATDNVFGYEHPKFARAKKFSGSIKRIEDDDGIVHFSAGDELKKGEKFLITGLHPFAYEVLITNKTYFINKDDVSLSDNDLNRVQNLSVETINLCKSKVSLELLDKNAIRKKNFIKALKKLSKHGLAIFDHSRDYLSSPNNFVMRIYNPTRKTIKYVSFTIVGLNRVNDPIPIGKNQKMSTTVKITGPIAPGVSAKFDWKNVFNNEVSTYKIKSIMVDYTDGSKKSINNAKEITLTPEHLQTYLDQFALRNYDAVFIPL